MNKLDKEVDKRYSFVDKLERKFFILGFKAGYKLALSKDYEMKYEMP